MGRGGHRHGRNSVGEGPWGGHLVGGAGGRTALGRRKRGKGERTHVHGVPCLLTSRSPALSDPQQTEGFRKRWFTMDDRRLMYFKDPLVREGLGPAGLGPL